MAKRFTDTAKWTDPWYRKLKPVFKSFWEYLRDSCDKAGYWKKDFEAAQFFIDEIFDPLDALQAINKDKKRIIEHGEYWQIVDFISFQYGVLTKDCKPHRQILDLIEKYDFKGYGKGINTLQEKDKEKEKERGGVGGQRGNPTLEEVRSLFQEKGCPAEAEKFFDYYESNGWRVGKNPMKNWRSSVANWLRHSEVYGTQRGVQKPKKDCEFCSGKGYVPQGFKCGCWK